MASVGGLAAGLVGGISAYVGVEHALGAVFEDSGVGVLAAGATLVAWSSARRRVPRAERGLSE